MKKTAILVAGLLLVSGSVFAESALDFTGTMIKAKTNIVDTATNPINDDSNGDTDMILKLKYNIDAKTTATFEYNTDDNSDSWDNEAELILNRKEGKVEAQFDARVVVGATDADTALSGQSFLSEDQTSDKTFIKYNHTKDLAFTFYPFNMGLNNGKVFDHSDFHTDIPGVVVNYQNVYAGIGMDAIDGTDESVVALKAGASYKTAKAEFSAKYSGAYWDKDELTPKLGVVATDGTLGPITHDINFNLNYKATKRFTLDAEVGVNVLYDDVALFDIDEAEYDDVSTGFGMSLKGTYAATAKTSVYGQFKYTTDGYLSYEDMADWNARTYIDINANGKYDAGTDILGIKTGGIFELIAGLDYKLTEKLVLNGEAKLQAAGNEVYEDKDGKAQSSHFVLSTSATYKF